MSQRLSPSFLASVALLGVLSSGWTMLGQPLPDAGGEVNQTEMERTEELSESLANQLLDFSVAARNGNLAEMGRSVGETLRATPLPELEGFTPNWTRPGLQGGYLELAEKSLSTLTRQQWLGHWQRFVDSFSHIEDVRFKISGALFEEQGSGVTAQALLKFFLVGKKSAGHLLWVRGTGRVRAIQPPDSQAWVISTLKLDGVSVSDSSPAPFSEVASPAGVALTLPRYGSPGNDDFVYHGAASADVNGDGQLDLFVTGIRRNYLYLNQGDGRFQESARKTGIEITRPGTSPLFLDYDNDGDLDLFMAAVGDQMLFENRLVPDGKAHFPGYFRGVCSGCCRSGLHCHCRRREPGWLGRCLRGLLQPLRESHARLLARGSKRDFQPAFHQSERTGPFGRLPDPGVPMTGAGVTLPSSPT